MPGRFLPSKEILENLRLLSNNDIETRLRATKDLLVAVSSAADNETANYVLVRLVKGLTSSSENSRVGFSIAFTEVLRQSAATTATKNGSGGGDDDNAGGAAVFDVSVDKVLSLLQEHHIPQGERGDEKNCWFGQLFGLKSIIESGLLSTDDEWIRILERLLVIARKKSWLREPSAGIIVALIAKIPVGNKGVAPDIWRLLKESGLGGMSEGVAIKLTLMEYQAKIGGKRPANEQFPLDLGYLPTLAKILKESSVEQEDGVQQKGNWSAKLPFVWDLIIQVYQSDNQNFAKNEDMASFDDFWRIVVDESLFSANASDERKHWGFQVFSKMVASNDDPSKIKTIFSKNFTKSFINHLSSEERYLHKAAQKAVRAINAAAEQKPALVPTFVEQLLSNNGTPNFDIITKTKTVEKLMPFADASGLKKIVKLFREIILHPSESEAKAVERRRQWAADQLLSITRNSKTVKDESWLKMVVELFATCGHYHFLSLNDDQKLSAASQAMFRTRLLSCLATLMDMKEQKDVQWATRAVKAVNDLEEDGKYEFAIEMDEEIQEVKRKSLKLLHKIKKQRKSDSGANASSLQAFELLYALVILQVLNGDADSLQVLEELRICFDQLVAGKRKKKNKSESERSLKRRKFETHDHDEEEADPSQILTEILLSFVSKPSVLLRRLAKNVFSTFTDTMTESSLELMFDVLVTKESLAGQSELFDDQGSDEGDEDEADSDSESDEEMDSDVEIVDAEESEDDDDEESDDMSGDELSGEDITLMNADAMDEEEAERLDAALSAALGSAKADDDSDTDESMNDDQMMEIDEQLSKIFKERKKASTATKKAQNKEAKENIINFKNRVLELLEIYVKQRHADELSLSVMMPLLTLIRSTGSKIVAERGHGVIKALINASRKSSNKDDKTTKSLLPTPSSPKELLDILLPSIHEEAGRPSNNREHAAACSQCSLHVVKVLINADESYLDGVFAVYAESMGRWMSEEKYMAQPSFFSDLVNWAGSARKQKFATLRMN